MRKSYCLNSRVKSKILGLSLVSTMIFAFILLITVSSLVYVFRYNLLSINSMLESDKTTKVQEQYINKIKSSKKIPIGIETLGDYRFDNQLISKENIFSNKNIDISLYHAKPVAANEKIYHSVYFDGKLTSKKSFLFNKLTKHSMFNYDSEFLPINVPFVAPERMNDDQRLYHFKNDKILDKQAGYIGFLEKNFSWLLLSINDKVRTIRLNALDIDKGNYNVKIGWNLYQGRWQILMSIYDDSHIYIFKTTLEKLEKNTDRAILDLSNPIAEITDIRNIKTLTWYVHKNDDMPSIIVSSTSQDNEDNLSVRLYSIDYMQEKKKYISKLKDTLNGIGKYSYETVHVKALDPDFILAKSSLVVSLGKRLVIYEASAEDNQPSKFYMKLDEASIRPPLIIKKDKYNYYVITYDADRYYQYVYAKDTDILSKVKPKIFEDEKINNIQVAYGLKFITTKNNIYIDNFKGEQLAKIIKPIKPKEEK